jgi:type IV pilus assembly protein PilC
MIGYYPVESCFQKVEDDIMKGQSLRQGLQQFLVYLSKMIQLVKVGEETNQMDFFFAKCPNNISKRWSIKPPHSAA